MTRIRLKKLTNADENNESEIPAERQQLWRDLLKSGYLRVEYIQPGARSGAMIRERQVQFGDLLVCIGGGTGVEHLADAYLVRRKPVIPLDLPIGASREDGTGGPQRLNREALANPGDFFRLQPEQQSMGATVLSLLATKAGKQDVTEIAANFASLVSVLDRPIVFYVRLLNPNLPDFPDVERFFREVVDPTVTGLGYRSVEMGTDASRHGFMNVEIFDAVSFVKLADKEANLSSHYALERLAVKRYYIYKNSAGAQRCGNFQTNKAGTNNHHTFCRTCLGNDGLAVSERAEIMELRVGRAFNRQMDWLGSGGQQECAKFEDLSTLKHDPPSSVSSDETRE